MNESVCLVILFNHRFDTNIPKLRKIYGDRFSKIRFLIPFYNGSDLDVIPVFEASYQFQGFLIQAYEMLMVVGTDYYIFIADDLIINPSFNEKNIIRSMKGVGKKAIISSVDMLNKAGMFSWSHSRYSSRPFLSKATQWKENLIGYDAAMDKFAAFFGGEYPSNYDNSFFKKQPGESEEHYKEAVRKFKQRNGGTQEIPYPMAWGYSDFFVLNKEVMYNIAYTCGIFSSMNLFVEIALPTSFVLNILREDVVMLREDSEYYSKVMWNAEEIEQFAESTNYSYDNLVKKWDSRCRFIHPVKLSKWNV